MSNINVITNVLGSFGTNCYTVFNNTTREALIIDPADRGDYLIKLYKEQNIKPVAVLLTHGHVDHISALPEIKKEYPDITVYAGVEEKDVLSNPTLNLSGMFGTAITMEADKYVADNEEISLLGATIKCIHVPGHTKGGTCYYFASEDLLFSGDTLFASSVGRSDFPTGDEAALMENIEKKLFALPEQTLVYPGHNNRTTIKREKSGNPFFF